ncbi:hypothetical protein ACQRIT_001410 [Beauveria bassiana]
MLKEGSRLESSGGKKTAATVKKRIEKFAHRLGNGAAWREKGSTIRNVEESSKKEQAGLPQGQAAWLQWLAGDSFNQSEGGSRRWPLQSYRGGGSHRTYIDGLRTSVVFMK